MEGFSEKDRVLFKRVRARRGIRDETAIILYAYTHTRTAKKPIHTDFCIQTGTKGPPRGNTLANISILKCLGQLFRNPNTRPKMCTIRGV